MSLTDWLRNGWLTEHETSPSEIADLLGVVERDLDDSQTQALRSDVNSGHQTFHAASSPA